MQIFIASTTKSLAAPCQLEEDDHHLIVPQGPQDVLLGEADEVAVHNVVERKWMRAVCIILTH